jgi:hypothetical protein
MFAERYQSTSDVNQKINNAINLIFLHPINLVLIGSIWIFIGTILASKYKLSNAIIVLFCAIAQWVNHSIPA